MLPDLFFLFVNGLGSNTHKNPLVVGVETFFSLSGPTDDREKKTSGDAILMHKFNHTFLQKRTAYDSDS